VLVIIAVAANAFGIKLFLVNHAGMAGIAFCTVMLAKQGISGFATMVEVCRRPGMFCVAITASLAITAGMYVIQPVAARAFLRGFLVLPADMATVAFEFCMLFTQDKLRLVMIELLASPAAFRVTVGALFAQAPAVNIILLMAGRTAHRRIPVLSFPGMTKVAAGGGVCTPERIVRNIMVKGFDTKLYHIRVPSLVISVTVPAICALHTCAPVVSQFAGDICCNRLMAVMAKRVLFIPGEWQMTPVALGFILRMSCYHLARHH
jgi:hypothetical protein